MVVRNVTTMFDHGYCSQQRTSLLFLTPLPPSSCFRVRALTAAMAPLIFRTVRGIDGISGNGGNSRRDGVTSRGDPFTHVPVTMLYASHWWCVVSSPVNMAHVGRY